MVTVFESSTHAVQQWMYTSCSLQLFGAVSSWMIKLKLYNGQEKRNTKLRVD